MLFTNNEENIKLKRNFHIFRTDVKRNIKFFIDNLESPKTFYSIHKLNI